jgi:two-component system, NtrC family, sensor histidine kinase KinB
MNMLGLRQKLFLGFGGMLVLLVIIGVQSVQRLSSLGVSIDVILRENYRSVIACQEMKEALERMDSGLLFILLGEEAKGEALVTANKASFRAALQVELDTITLPGEGEKAATIRDSFGQFESALAGVVDPALSVAARRGAYFDRVFPLFERIKDGVGEIQQMNQQNMSEANDRARHSAASARKQMFVLLLAGTVLAAAFLLLTGRWILRPIQRLTGSAEEIRRGNLDLVVAAGSRDEIGRLSEAFNAMAASLREFRRTDQARLVRIRRATQEAFNSLPDAVAVIDPEGKVEVATGSAGTVFGLKPGVRISDPPFIALADLIRTAIKEGRTAVPGPRGEIQMFVGGEERYFSPKAVPILDRDRLADGAVLFLSDVTQLRQQDEIKKGVIRMVSHQLRTPLTSIRMAIHLLLEEKVGPLTEKQAELLVTAKEDSDRLHGILSDLLDISRMGSGNAMLEFRTAPPRTVILDAIEPFRRAAQDQGVELIPEVKGDLPDVLVDVTRIGYAFGNLISNALKYTPPGGRIAVGAAAEEGFVRFSVSDTGEGIPESFLPRVFEPFFRVPGDGRATGAGLGLAIVKEIVEAHGGTVNAESRPEAGSTFTFTLRRADRGPGEEVRS